MLHFSKVIRRVQRPHRDALRCLPCQFFDRPAPEFFGRQIQPALVWFFYWCHQIVLLAKWRPKTALSAVPGAFLEVGIILEGKKCCSAANQLGGGDAAVNTKELNFSIAMAFTCKMTAALR